MEHLSREHIQELTPGEITLFQKLDVRKDAVVLAYRHVGLDAKLCAYAGLGLMQFLLLRSKTYATRSLYEKAVVIGSAQRVCVCRRTPVEGGDLHDFTYNAV